MVGPASTAPHPMSPLHLFCTKNFFERCSVGILASSLLEQWPSHTHLCHGGTGLGSCLSCTCPAPHSAVLLMLRGHVASPSGAFYSPVPWPGHWGFLLQELGAGNSKRDRWGEHSLVCGRPTFGLTELHWDSSLCLLRSLGRITQQTHMGILVLFYIYIYIY